jgi:hypothetical protein
MTFHLSRTKEGQALKAAVGNTILKDGGLTPATRLVGWFIADHWNEAKGISYPPIAYIAKELSLCERAVRNAIKGDPRRKQPGLNSRYFSVEKTGRNYVYRFKVSTPAQLAVRRSQHAAVDSGTLRQRQRHIATETMAPIATHPSDPSKTYGEGNAVPTAAGKLLGETAWLSAKDILGRRLDMSVMKAWIEKLTVVSLTEEECVLSAPTNMIRSYISQHFLDLLEAAWRQTVPTIQTVRLIVRALAHDPRGGER